MACVQYITALCWWLSCSVLLQCVICFDLLCCRYGFRKPPHLELKARPKLGEREVTLAHVTDWIEKKLDQEFQVLINTYLQIHFIFLGSVIQRQYYLGSVPEAGSTSSGPNPELCVD